MTIAFTIYRRARHYCAWLMTRKDLNYTLSFLLYAFELEKNRAWNAVLLAIASFLFIPLILTIITLMKP